MYHSTRVQELRSERAFKRAQHALAPKPMEQANFARRSFRERQTALQLAQFASAHDDLDLGSDQVENLVGTLIVSLIYCSNMTSARSQNTNLLR